MTKTRIDLELHWALKESLFHTDRFYDGLRDLKRYPYRLYINDELLSERDFNETRYKVEYFNAEDAGVGYALTNVLSSTTYGTSWWMI